MDFICARSGPTTPAPPQDTVGQRVYERARTILSPDQLDTWGKYQTNRMQMMRMGMNMAKKMFAPDTSASDAAPPGE